MRNVASSITEVALSLRSKRTLAGRVLLLVVAGAPLLLVGCGGLVETSHQPQQIAIAGLRGSVHGGQQPIVGASIFLYAAGTSTYAAQNTNILTVPVQTSTDGSFGIGGDYTCTAGQQMYLAAVGGNPGGGTNSNQVTVAAIGDCNTLTSSVFLQMNEVTTVAAAYALAPFATGYTTIGASASNIAGLKRAFVNAAKLANASLGTAVGTLPPGATAPTSELYSLANILSSCVNSQGGTATDTSTNCGKLFSYTKPATGAAPTDVFAAALNIAKNPAANVSSLYALASASPPFLPALSSAPNDWSVSIVYAGGSLNSPHSTTVDANGQIWVANTGNNTVSVLAQSGTPIGASPLSANGLNGPTAVAIDTTGNAWVADTAAGAGTRVSAFTASGGTLPGSPFLVGTGPTSLAFDAAGNLWVANQTSNNVTELNAAGTLLQTPSSGIVGPGAIAIDPK